MNVGSQVIRNQLSGFVGRHARLAVSRTVVSSSIRCACQRRFININPFSWKNDEKATPKQKELSEALERGTRGDIYALKADPTLKLFEAQPSPLPISQAKKFPSLKFHNAKFKGVKLPDSFGKGAPALIAFTLRPNIALDMAQSWIDPWLQEFPDLQAYNVTILTNPGYRAIGPLLQYNLTKATPPARWGYEGVHYAPLSYFSVNKSLTDLGLINTNMFAAYIFIVHNGVVRWKAVGLANEKELGYMKRVVRELQAEK